MRIWTASDIIEMFGIPYHSLTYWESRGKIPRARRTENRKRIYTEEDVAALRRAIQMARLGEQRRGS